MLRRTPAAAKIEIVAVSVPQADVAQQISSKDSTPTPEGEPPRHVAALEAHPSIVVLPLQELERVLAEVRDHDASAWLEDAVHLDDRPLRRLCVMQAHVGEHMVHHRVTDWQALRLAESVLDA